VAFVTDPSIRQVFCEGQPNSLDVAFLNRVIPIGKAEVIPAGGKYALRAFIQGRMSSYGSPESWPDYLAFRDRDFDAEPSETPGLIRLEGKTPIWLTYRACIESYFINSQLLHDYWAESATGPRWRHGLPPAIESIQVAILQASHDLADYQAVRWALAKLKPGPRWPEIDTKWTERSGDLPPSLAFDDCLAEARKMVDAFAAQVSGVTTAKLEGTAQDYRLRFTQDDFYSQSLFLVWFHGKDLLSQLSGHLPSNFPYRRYAEWAASRVDLSRYSDLQQLAEMCA